MKMVTVANLNTLIQAQQLKARLAASGIEAFIPDEVSAGVVPLFFVTKAGVRVQVAEEFEDDARAIVEGEVGAEEG